MHGGSDCHKYVNKLIKSNKELLVISPYIDGYYANLLTKRRKKTYVISSSMSQPASKMMNGYRSTKPIIFLILFLLALNYLVYLVSDFFPVILIASIMLIYMTLLLTRTKKGKVNVKTPKRFVHAKVYISDNVAIVGSANLTQRGMYSNIEHIDIIRDNSEINKLRKMFWEMWDNP